MMPQASTAPKLLRSGGLREFARLAAEATAVGLFASLVLLVAALFIATAEAASPELPSTGALLFKGDDASIPAPLLATDVSIDVAGVVARTRVTQRFANPGDDWREGVYVFPLPESAAVDHLEMRIGERRIQGQIRERAQARKEYEQAKQDGKKAALVEQERPNLFTTSVAPIGPNEEIVVQIEYQQTLPYDSGAFSIRFPMAITPRYVPGAPNGTAASGTGWSADTDRVPDASRVTPPVVHPSQGKVLPVTLSVSLDAGFALAKIESRHHAVKIDETVDGRYQVTLGGPMPADRDFELQWTPDVGRAPGAAIFVEPKDGKSYALVMLMPSPPDTAMPRMPREATYIVDTSGSMAGTSIVQAKAALMYALDRLAPGDRFNVIEFNSRARPLFEVPMPVDPATLGRARSFVTGLKADGGTEMREALTLALRPPKAEGFVRQVVFLTDGAVGNENELFALIRERLDDRRLFTVGIGAALNSHFMTKAAQFGRGTFTSIGDTREVQEKMAALFRKLESPVLTDVAVDWPSRAEAWPTTIPDLYAGEPIVVTAVLDTLDGEIALRGRHGGKAWRTTLPLSGNGTAAGIGVLWARAKIEALADAQIAGANADDIRAEIVRVALAHHLVSKFTSLVAVDITPTAPADVVATRTAIPGNLPHGQQFEAIFGGLPQTATPATRNALVALALLIAAAVLLAFARRERSRALLPVLALSSLLVWHAGESHAQRGTFVLLPGAFDGNAPTFQHDEENVTLDRLPGDGWHVLDLRDGASTLERASEGGKVSFLAELAMPPDAPDEHWQALFWLRVPGAALAAGPVPRADLESDIVELERRYAASLGTVAFAFSAVPFDNGQLFVVEIGAARFEYALDGPQAMRQRVLFAGDLDGDHRPDFIIFTTHRDGGAYSLLLSSVAAPGRNTPAAELRFREPNGC
jgi:Ca-activated chloride channel homolog